MLSRRIPEDFEPNELTRLLEEKRRAGAPILDLTETNPTRVGLGGAGPKELRALADPGGSRYDPDPRGLLPAREAIARYHGERAADAAGAAAGAAPAAGAGVPVSPDDIVLTSSTSEAYAHLFRLLCDAGDEVLIPRPSYPLFEPLAALESVRAPSYRLRYHDRWYLDLDSLDASLSPRTRAVILVEPNNPTGSCSSADEAARVGALCAERGIALISDEVFGDFPRPGRPPLPTMLGRTDALTFVLGGISKSCGMPQLKLGWILLSGPPEVKERALRGLEWIADLFLSSSTPLQNALPTLLEARGPFQRAVRQRLERNLERLSGLRNTGRGFRVLEADGGWSAVVEAPITANDFALAALREQNVHVHPGHYYDLERESVVLSLLPDPGVFDQALARMERIG